MPGAWDCHYYIRFLRGLPFFYNRIGGDYGLKERIWWRDERQLRHDWQILINGAQMEIAVLTPRAIYICLYVKAPRCCDTYEVLWGFYLSVHV